jgi:hypothetical protein
MAQDSDLSKTSDKGKGKAVEGDRKPGETQKDAAASTEADGKKDADKADCMFAPVSRYAPVLTRTHSIRRA